MHKSVQRTAAFLTAAIVFGLDRWSKVFIQSRLGAFDSKTIIPGFFNLVRSENPGVAFGIFADSTTKLRTLLLIVVSVAAVGIIGRMLWRVEGQDRMSASGLSLILGGALGNVYDRVIAGTVTDFLDFYAGSYHWYTFNFADTAICIGVGLLLLAMFTGNRGLSRAGSKT